MYRFVFLATIRSNIRFSLEGTNVKCSYVLLNYHGSLGTASLDLRLALRIKDKTNYIIES